MNILKITAENFETEVKGSDKPVLVDFYADWCGPCRMLAPTVEEIASERPDIKVGKINVDEEMPLAIAYGVETIPLLLVFKGGEVVGKSVGLRPKDAILSLID